MTECYNRLKKLFDSLGIDTDDGFNDGEIYAYAVGLSLIEDMFNAYDKRIFPPSVNPIVPYEYIDLLGSYFAQRGSLSAVILGNRFSSITGYVPKNEFNNATIITNVQMWVYFEDGAIAFDQIGVKNLLKVADIINSYIPVNITPRIIGGSLTCSFSSWDNWNKSWYDLDRLCLPFNIIDSLRVDYYE